jgi:hypothetical protein
MRLGRRTLAILFAVAGLMVVVPAPAQAAQNCALTRAGDVYCYGPGTPVRVQVTGKVVQLAASGDSTCALTEPGEVYCWAAASAAAPDEDTGLGLSPLLLITVGLLLVGGGVTLVMLSRPGDGRPGQGRSGEGRSGEGRSGEGRSGEGRPGEGRPQGARWRAASRNLPAPSLSRSV